ncbi:MAG TPA: anhydro-N-acetylmuramic acid kinase [Polyangia bacterium]|nr:anhydro-N-acetylmuramic acid kinase [Polyangia bacterium]
MARADDSDPVARFLALRQLPARVVVGLMSGTSGDGVDAAVVEIAGAGASTRARLLAFSTVPFPEPLRQRLFALDRASASELTALDALLGELFASAALDAIAAAGLDADRVHLVASHGHTACHQPRSAGHAGATMQVAEGAVIAERTGLPVLCDFRVRDVAAGGEGAPLVPLADWILFRAPGRVRALQNLGGIANVTIAPERLDDVFAFDNAPGNMVLDGCARAASDDSEPFDRDGARAARGRIDHGLVAELLEHPYLALAPPKSTGRETFGQSFLAPLVDRFMGRLDDLQATLTRFVAEAISSSFSQHVVPRTQVDELYVSGGGVHNQTLMRHLSELLAPVPVRSLSELGWDPDAKEAVAFAILANETLHGQPGNLPAATGAFGPRVLGKLVF